MKQYYPDKSQWITTNEEAERRRKSCRWDTVKFVAALAGVLALVLMVPLGLALQPLFEARAYNKFTTGPQATYWDALWVRLIVTPDGGRSR